MILALLPTGMTLVMVIGAALCVGAMALFIVLAIARASSTTTEFEQFKQSIEDITKSELERDRKEKNIVNPKTWEGYWYKLVEATGRTPTSSDQPGMFVLIGVIVLAALGLLVFPGGMIGLISMPLAGLFLAKAYLEMEAKKRMNTLNKQLPSLISGLTANIMASQTPQNALISVADDTPAPLGDELKIMKNELQVNVPLDEALDHLAERVPSRDVKFLVSAVKIAAASGTDLVPQLKIINQIIIGRTRLQQKLASAISSVSPTIWVSAIVIPAMFIFQYISSVENRDFWFTIQGIVALIVVAAMYAGGLFISKKMVKGVENA